jgi:hypothetical protein
MSAAILQGTPATTLDTDIWVNLPSRHCMRVLNLCVRLGGTVRANTVVELSDGSLVNFLYEIHGLHSFRTEFRQARIIPWLGTQVAALPLKRIHASKSFVRRPKDLAHLPLLEQTMALQQRLRRRTTHGTGRAR